MSHLQHLNVSHAEVEVGGVAENEGCAEQQAYGQDGAQEHLLRYVNILGTVKQMRGSLQNASSYRLCGLIQRLCHSKIEI